MTGPKNHPQATVDRALDLVAAEVDDHGVPARGAFARAGEAVGVGRDLVYRWWVGELRTSGDNSHRIAAVQRGRERARELAADELRRVVQHVVDLASETDDPNRAAACLNALRQVIDGERPAIGIEGIKILVDAGVEPGPLEPPVIDSEEGQDDG